MRGQLLIIGALLALGACSGSGPDRSTDAATYSDAFENGIGCDNTDTFLWLCGFNSSARDDEAPATIDDNYNIEYTPSEDDAAHHGWRSARRFANTIHCDEFPTDRPTRSVRVRCGS